MQYFFPLEIPITVERLPNSGTFGLVQVDFITLTSVQTYNHLPAGVARAADTDFVFTNNSVVFSPGITSVQFNITITDDEIPEVDESVFVILSGVYLLEQAQNRPCKLMMHYGMYFSNTGPLTIFHVLIPVEC